MRRPGEALKKESRMFRVYRVCRVKGLRLTEFTGFIGHYRVWGLRVSVCRVYRVQGVRVLRGFGVWA